MSERPNGPKPPPEARIDAALEPGLRTLLSPLENFLRLQSSSGLILIAATLAALVLRNSGYADSYLALRELPIALHVGSFHLELSFLEWVNDGLMALLFFLLGLELKREFLIGELRKPSRLVPVACAAAGGMLAPALLFLAFNHGTEFAAGWGIPVATDVAFALGVLLLLGDRIPRAIKVFLVTFALLDDLGAILIIVLAYSSAHLSGNIVPIGLSLAAIVLLNLGGVRRGWPYLLVGCVLWYWLHHAGIHGTIAGVIVALAAPASPQIRPRFAGRAIRQRMEKLRLVPAERIHDHVLFEDPKLHRLASEVERVANKAISPVRRWEAAMDAPVFYLVVPVFAFLNAGVVLSTDIFANVFATSLGLGIVVGLVAGKVLGVSAGALLGAQLTPGKILFPNVVASDLLLLGGLAGIGFTMSILIAGLAFAGQPAVAEAAIAAILVASAIAAIVAVIAGLLLARLRRVSASTPSSSAQ